MAIKIQTQKPEIPIEIGDLKFAFDISDESVENFHKNAQEVIGELSKLKDDDVKAAREVIRKGYDFILGEGSFEKVYEISPSVVICMQYLFQIAEGIEQELKQRGFLPEQEQLAQKYLNPVK